MARTPTPAASPATETQAPTAPAAAQPAPVDTAPPTTEDPPIDGVEVRVLVAFDDAEPNDVLLLAPAELRARLAAGQVDDDEEAVAYAKSLLA